MNALDRIGERVGAPQIAIDDSYTRGEQVRALSVALPASHQGSHRISLAGERPSHRSADATRGADNQHGRRVTHFNAPSSYDNFFMMRANWFGCKACAADTRSLGFFALRVTTKYYESRRDLERTLAAVEQSHIAEVPVAVGDQRAKGIE